MPLHLVAYHVSRWMPGPQWTTLFWLWYSPRHLLLLVAGTEHGMVPMIFTAFLRSCGNSKPSCSCLWSKVKTLWEEVTKTFELCPWQQMPFGLSSHGTHSRTITEHDWAKYAHECRVKFLQRQMLPQSFHSGTMMNVYVHSTDCSLAEGVIFSLLVCNAAALLVTHILEFNFPM